MLVRRRSASLNLNSRINLRMVGTTTTTNNIVTIMARREGILTMTKEHEQAMVPIGQVM